MQKLGKNRGGYHGEQIEIASLLRDIAARATKSGWMPDLIATTPAVELSAWHRPNGQARRLVYISSGIHGDEPAGPLAIQRLLQEDNWPGDVGLTLCPCLNPTGFLLNQRENARGIDLNRQYLHLEAEETRAHVEWLQRQPGFDVAICLHEDWESQGFYLYELNPDHRPSHAEKIIREVAGVCPIDASSEIEGRPAHNGIIRPSVDPLTRAQWPEAFWLLKHKTRHSYTLEAPSDFPLETRVAALVTAVKVVLEG